MQWVRRDDVFTPGQRAHHAMAYDSDRGVTVFFGGEIGTSGDETYFNDTWEYDGKSWQRTPVLNESPSPRSFHAMAYDPVNKIVLMYGGFAGGLFGLNDTWAYQHEVNKVPRWSHLGGKAEDIYGLAGMAMAYATSRSRILRVGGMNTFGGTQGPAEYWSHEWNGSTWVYLSNGPQGWGLAFASSPTYNLVFGGYDGIGTGHHVIGKTESFQDGTWSGPKSLPGPGARGEACMAFDTRRNRFVMVGGNGTGEEVWEYSKETGWTPGLPLPHDAGRAGAAMVYDEKRGVMVLMGGAGGGAPNGNDGGRYLDTWELVPVPVRSTIEVPPLICTTHFYQFGVRPSDGRSLVYQWNIGGEIFSSTTDPVSPSVLIPAAGDVLVEVTMTDLCGSSFTNRTTVTIHPPPFVTDIATNAPLVQCPGGSIQLTAQIDSFEEPHIQWLHNTSPLLDQTNATLSLVNLKPVDTGEYTVIVSNRCGETVPVPEPLHLQVGPSILSHPTNVVAKPCDSADFSIAAVGAGTLRYHWRKNGELLEDGAPFSGVYTTNLHVEPLVYSLEAAYDVVVTDDCGEQWAVTSEAAILRLPTPPWIDVGMKPVAPAPQARFRWVSDYDENRGVTVMYGGATFRRDPSNSLWEYDGVSWKVIQDGYLAPVTTNGQKLFSNNQFAPSQYDIVYNPDDHLMYLFGEASAATPLTIWTWDGHNWQQPYSGPVGGGSQQYRAMYDRQNHKILFTRTRSADSYDTDLFIYDPASNVLTKTVQPPFEPGNFRAFWVYDEFRKFAIWYQNTEIVDPTMWLLNSAMSWTKLPGASPLPARSGWTATYDTVRREVVVLGGFPPALDPNPWYTGTWAFPGDPRARLTSLADWSQELPDGPPRNSAGSELAPSNNFEPETMTFDRRRRARVAPGYVGPDSITGQPPFPAWTVYESRYKDAIEFDAAPSMQKVALGATLTLQAHASGYGALTYTWRRNGAAIKDGIAGASKGGGTVTGATKEILTISGVTAADFAAYDVVVSNRCGALMSPQIVVSLAASPDSPVISPPVIGNGQISIPIAVPRGSAITIESAAVVAGPWTKVGNVETTANGTAQFNAAIQNAGIKFYRAVWPAY